MQVHVPLCVFVCARTCMSLCLCVCVCVCVRTHAGKRACPFVRVSVHIPVPVSVSVRVGVSFKWLPLRAAQTASSSRQSLPLQLRKKDPLTKCSSTPPKGAILLVNHKPSPISQMKSIHNLEFGFVPCLRSMLLLLLFYFHPIMPHAVSSLSISDPPRYPSTPPPR